MQTEEGQAAGQKLSETVDYFDGIIPIPGAGLASEIISLIVLVMGGRKFWGAIKASKPGSMMGKEPAP